MPDEIDPFILMNRLALLTLRVDSAERARLRIAVTPAEHEGLRQLCLEREGVFTRRIMGFPLVVEEQPLDPPFVFEYPSSRTPSPDDEIPF